VLAGLDQWSREVVSGWHDWIDLPLRAGDALGALLGAAPGEVIATDSVTVNLYKLVCAALDARGGGALVTDRGNFPTDRYVLEGIAAARGLELRIFDSDDLDGPVAEDLAGLEQGDVLVLSHVAYRSGALADMAGLTAAAKERGATLIWDLSHSAGAVPVDLRGAGAELAVGCTYKYLNAGPGAPGYLFVAAELQDALRSPIQGWFGQREQFAMERPYDPAPGIERFLAGTPPIGGLIAVREGARLVAEAGVHNLAEQAAALTDRLIARTEGLGLELATPREAHRRGAHIALCHPDAWRITRALAQAGVVGDFRPPDILRLGVNPLYTTEPEIDAAAHRLRDVLATGAHERLATTRTRVT